MIEIYLHQIKKIFFIFMLYIIYQPLLLLYVFPQFEHFFLLIPQQQEKVPKQNIQSKHIIQSSHCFCKVPILQLGPIYNLKNIDIW